MKEGKWINWLSTFVLCFLFWMLLVFSVRPRELILGAVVAAVVAALSSRFLIHESPFYLYNPVRIGMLLAYSFGVFLKELVKANFSMAKLVLSKDLSGYRPGILRIPASSAVRSQYGEAMVANSITLTPGTITMDVAEDGDGQDYYYVQWAQTEETDREKAGEIIKGSLERGIGRIWK